MKAKAILNDVAVDVAAVAVKTVLVLAAVVALFGIVGHFEYQDETQEEILYCENVSSGRWPDYEGIYNKVCKAEYGKPKKFVNYSL